MGVCNFYNLSNFSDIILTGTTKGYINIYLLWSHNDDKDTERSSNSDISYDSQTQINVSSCFCSIQ